MNLMEVFAEQVHSRPDAVAIVEPVRGREQAISFSALDDRSARLAALLRREGVNPGDTVLVLQPISVDLYASLLAIFRIGAVALFVDASAGRRQFDRRCELLPPRAFVAVPKAHWLRVLSPAVRRIPHKFVSHGWLPGAISLAAAFSLPPFSGCERCAPDAPALVTFTSGSTGLPKAVVRTHALLLAQRHAIQSHLQLVPGEVDLTTLPVFLLANLAVGVTSIIPQADLRTPGAIRPEPVLAQISRHQVTRVTASPAFFERLLVNPLALRGLRKIYTGGAPVFPRLFDRLSRAAPDARIESVYGSTEAEPIAHLWAGDIGADDRTAMRRGHGLLAGLPIPEIRLRVIRHQWGAPLGPLTAEAFAAMQLAPNQIGEIVVNGDHVIQGYLHGRGDEQTKISVQGEIWHRTGDAGQLDASGRLWLLGRCEARVQDSHGELYPFAVECVATELPSVRRAAFVSHNGKRILALEPGPGFDDSTCNSLKAELEWASLDEILPLTNLPVDKRHNAKIDYPALRRILEDQ